MAMITVYDIDTGISGDNGKNIKTIAIFVILVIAGIVPALARSDMKVFHFKMTETILLQSKGNGATNDSKRPTIDVVLFGPKFGNQLIGMVTPEGSYTLVKCSGRWSVNEVGALTLKANGKTYFVIHHDKCIINSRVGINNTSDKVIIQFCKPTSVPAFKSEYDKLYSFLKSNSLINIATKNKSGGGVNNGGADSKKRNSIPRPAGLPDVVEMLSAKQLKEFRYAPSNSIGLRFKSTYHELGGLSLENCENHPLGLTNISWPKTEMRLINDLVDNKYGFRAYYHEISYGQTFTSIILHASQLLPGSIDMENLKAVMRSDRCGMTLSVKKDGTLSGVNSTWLFKPTCTSSIRSYDFASLEKKFRKQFEKYVKWLLNEFERQGYQVTKKDKNEYGLTLSSDITSTIEIRPDKNKPLDSVIRISVYKTL